MTDRQLHRRPYHENNFKKCRLTFGSCGAFLFDKFSNKSIFPTKIYHFLPRATAFKIFA